MLRPREENKKRIREIKAKSVIVIALLLWFVTAINMCIKTWKMYSQKEDVVTAFSSEIYSDLTADISTNGYLGSTELTENAKYIILEEIADKIGIYRYNISSDESGCTCLSQKSTNGNVVLKIITITNEANGEMLEQKQYLCMNIKLNNSIQAANTYREILESILEEYKINATVNVDLSGSVSGKMLLEDMKSLSDTLMSQIGGKVKIEKYAEDFYTVYGYDSDIDTVLQIGKEKVNVNITMSYDEINNQTMVHMSTPINNQDY